MVFSPFRHLLLLRKLINFAVVFRPSLRFRASLCAFSRASSSMRKSKKCLFQCAAILNGIERPNQRWGWRIYEKKVCDLRPRDRCGMFRTAQISKRNPKRRCRSKKKFFLHVSIPFGETLINFFFFRCRLWFTDVDIPLFHCLRLSCCVDQTAEIKYAIEEFGIGLENIERRVK